MGWFDSLTGGGDAPEDDGPDAYRVVRKTKKGGWKPVDGFDEMGEPIDKGTFEYNAAPLDPGEYRLFAIDGNLQTQPPEGVGWVLQVEGERDTDSGNDEIRRLEQKIDRLQESGEQQDPQDPQQAVEQQKATLQLAALQSEDFLKRYGDQIILSMFDGNGSGGGSSSAIGYDDWQENPMGASLYETMHMVREEPEQIERLGEAIGRGVGTFVGSAADGYADPDAEQSLAEAKEGRDAPADTERDAAEQQPGGGRDLDAGPSDLGDLGADTPAVETDDLAADLAEARTTARRAGPGEQDRAADAPHSEDAPDQDDSDTDPAPDEPPTPESDTPDPAPEPDATAADAPDPDPMTASPDDPTPDDREASSDERADEIAGRL